MSDIRSQYRIITTGAGRTARQDRGRLRFDGRDAVVFLQALVSNDVTALDAGHGVYATYLTAQGRMISDLRIHQRGDHLLVEVPASLTGRLLSAFDALIFSEDVIVSDVSASVSQIAVIGTGAADAVARALTIDAGRLNGLAPLAGIGGGTTFVARADDSEAWPVFDVFVSRDEAASVESALERAGAAQISPEVLEAARIEAGRPAFGVDMTDETIPLEAGLLDRGISTTKGCYVGQEIIIRVLHRGGGRVAKRLSRLELDASATEAPVAGAALSADGKDIGKITSAAFSPARDRIVALGYVHRDFAETGRSLVVAMPQGNVGASILGLAG